MDIHLPPGFRFFPTDEELITHYLAKKVTNDRFNPNAIAEVDMNRCEPWDLPSKAKMGEKEFYFFWQIDRKYPTGMRTNRTTVAGYWKATGKDKEIYRGKGCLVGMKKTLVFYKGRAPKGEKTNWVMHEFRLEGNFSYCNLPQAAKEKWVVCRIFHRNSSGIKKDSIAHDSFSMNSFGDIDNVFDYATLPRPMDSGPNSFSDRPGCSYLDSQENDTYQEFKAVKTPSIFFNDDNNNIPNYWTNFSSGIPAQEPVLPDSFQSSTANSFPREIARGRKTKQSQDTGLSGEMNNSEISSVVSKNTGIGIRSNKSFEDMADDLQCFFTDY